MDRNLAFGGERLLSEVKKCPKCSGEMVQGEFLKTFRKRALAKYDVFLEIRNIKGFKHEDSKTVYRRMDALNQEGWIAQKGTRPAKVQGESTLYEVTMKGKAALKLDQKSIEDFFQTATDEQLLKFIEAFSD
jgi:DNA-binding PadR family transcriptional regulator